MLRNWNSGTVNATVYCFNAWNIYCSWDIALIVVGISGIIRNTAHEVEILSRFPFWYIFTLLSRDSVFACALCVHVLNVKCYLSIKWNSIHGSVTVTVLLIAIGNSRLQ